METLAGLVIMGLMLLILSTLFFLLLVQPFWAVADVAVSKEYSRRKKAVIILLTLFLLGPVLSFFMVVSKQNRHC